VSGPLGARPFPTMKPPPMSGLVVQYLTPLLAPTPVSTRRPQPKPEDDVAYPDGYVRVEGGGGLWVVADENYFFDASAIIHGYGDYENEWRAEDLCGTALAWGGNAQGLTLDLEGTGWYVTYSRITALAVELVDPQVRLTRYRGMITWRIPGAPIIPPVSVS
jgi:hypothetical protein